MSAIRLRRLMRLSCLIIWVRQFQMISDAIRHLVVLLMPCTCTITITHTNRLAGGRAVDILSSDSKQGVKSISSPSVRHKFVSYLTQSFIVGSTTNTKFYCLLSIRCKVLLFFYPFSTKFYHLLSVRCKVLLFFIHSTQSFTIYVTTKLQCE